MRKIKLFLSLLMLIAFSVGNVWADPAAVGTTLFSENFGSYSANNVPSGSVTTATGRVVYGNGSVTYTCTASGTKIYNENTGGGTAPEILVAKNGGTFVIAGIPSGGAKVITVSLTQNNQALSVAPSGTGYSGSVSGKPGAVGTRTFDITVADGADATFTLTFTGSGSSNVRVDNILVTVKTAGEGAAPVTPTCAKPTFDPEDGETFTDDIDVEIAAESGTTIYYTTDGEDPTTSSDVYTTALNFTETTTLKAIAVKEGSNNSAVATATYTKVEPFSGSVLEIVKSDFTNTSYDDNAGDHEKSGITFTTAKVYQSGGGIQFQKTNGLLYNKTDLGEISKIEITKVSGKNNNLVVYSGTSENPTSGAVTGSASGDMTTYTFASGKGYFAIKCNSTGASNVDPIKIYYSGAAILPSAELAFTDENHLAKVGANFTAPTLTNPHSVAVTYASSDADVVAVSADGATITIKAAGKAEITASFAGDENYKEGSASYTIYVATEAGTAADPLTEASAKSLIDLGCEMEVHVHGTVLGSQDATKFTVTLADGFQFYKLKDLGNVAFESAYIKNGDEVTAVGTLTKYNTTYELAEGCYLTAYTEYTEPLVDISNTKETAYTVAQALALATNPTSDLTKAVYITGVVYDVKSFNSTNGTLDIYIKDEGVENKFEFYKCAGIYDESLTAFTAADDVQVGDEVIGYGVMKYFSGGSIWEFDNTATGNYLVELTRPEVAVNSVELDQNAASIEVEETVMLHATVNPDNASNKGITWSITSGSDKASVDENGVVTGIEEGTAVIRAASAADATKFAECTVTVTAADPTKHVVTFDATVDKTTEATDLSITKGDLTIAVTEGDGRFNNGTDYRPYKNSVFTVSCSNGNITKIEFTCTTGKPITGFADLEGLDKANEVWTGNAASVSLTASGAQVQMTQLVITYKEDSRAAAGLAWSTDAVELTVGDAFTAPTLNNPNSIAASAITIASDNTDLAVVNEGVVSLVAEATGEATITATFAGNDDYKPAVVSYTITVNAAAPAVLTDYYQKVTETAGIVEGTYLIVYEDGENSLAFNGALGYDSDHKIDIENNTIDVAIVDGDKIAVSSATEASTFYIDPTAGSIQAACGKYIGVGGYSNGLSVSDNADAYLNALSIDDDDNAVIVITTTGGDMTLRYNSASNQARFRYYKSGQQPIALYKLANEVIKPEAGLAWDPAEDITLIVGDPFTAPTLLNPNSIDDAEITIASSNTDVATVTAGVVELAENATGTTTITATFAGNASYKPATVSYKITVNPAHSIFVSPSLNVNFGSVAKDATVDDKVISVTLTGVDAATATLGGTNPEAFSISPAALTASGDITISASSATAGTFAAKLTISDDAGVADSKVVNLSLTVTDPAAEETPISTSTKWVVATAADLVDGAEVIITGVKDEVVYAMGEQKSTNRAAYVASVDGEGVLTPGEGTMSFTLVAQEAEGVFALRTSDGKYLYAAASGSNHLKTQAEVDVNAQWTLAVNSAVAESSTNRNIMRFNGSGENKLFSCYSSGQTEIKFYVPKPVTPEPPVVDYTEVRNGLTEGWYYTMCLDKAVTAVQGGSIWRVLSKAENGKDVILEEVTGTLDAGRPYIFRAAASTLEVAYTGAAVGAPVTEGNNGLVGSFTEEPIAQSPNNYIIYNNALYYVNSDNVKVGAHRAYLNMTVVPAYSNEPQQGAPRRRVTMAVYGEQTATGIDAINATDAPVKMMINGQLFILRGEKMYDATGRLVK